MKGIGIAAITAATWVVTAMSLKSAFFQPVELPLVALLVLTFTPIETLHAITRAYLPKKVTDEIGKNDK